MLTTPLRLLLVQTHNGPYDHDSPFTEPIKSECLFASNDFVVQITVPLKAVSLMCLFMSTHLYEGIMTFKETHCAMVQYLSSPTIGCREEALPQDSEDSDDSLGVGEGKQYVYKVTPV